MRSNNETRSIVNIITRALKAGITKRIRHVCANHRALAPSKHKQSGIIKWSLIWTTGTGPIMKNFENKKL